MPSETSNQTSGVEAFVAAVLAIVGLISEALPVITFGWRLVIVLLSLVATLDFCLRSRFVGTRVPSPYRRLVLSLGVICVFVATFSTPIRRQYMQEHLPPSFAYLAGAWSGAAHYGMGGMVMNIFWRHYGPNPAYNIDLGFTDVDRRLITNKWLDQHPGGQDETSRRIACPGSSLFPQRRAGQVGSWVRQLSLGAVKSESSTVFGRY